MKTPLIERFASVLCGPRVPVVRDPNLLMDTSGSVKVYYAPFEYINPSARIVLVGITPGPTQMANANNEARRFYWQVSPMRKQSRPPRVLVPSAVNPCEAI